MYIKIYIFSVGHSLNPICLLRARGTICFIFCSSPLAQWWQFWLNYTKSVGSILFFGVLRTESSRDFLRVKLRIRSSFVYFYFICRCEQEVLVFHNKGNACSWSVWDSHSSAVSTRWKCLLKGYLQPLCAALSGCSGRWGYFLSLSAPFIVDKKFWTQMENNSL